MESRLECVEHQSGEIIVSLVHRLQIQKTLAGLGLGLFIAVQGLVFLEKGFTTWHIGIAYGVFAISAALLELPLGALADIRGRIHVFRWSLWAEALAWLVAIFASQFWQIIFAMFLLGFGRALNTGTIDAWQIEQINKQGLNHKLAQLLARFQSTSSIAIGIGAVCGGYLPEFIGNQYGLQPTEWNMVACVLFVTSQMILLPWLFQEGDQVEHKNKSGQVHHQIKKTLIFGWQSQIIRPLFWVSFVIGIIVICIEAFWQVQIKTISPDVSYRIFGWLALGYFLSGAIGPISIGWLMTRINLSESSWISLICALIVPTLYLLSIQNTVVGFTVYYLLFMALFSMTHIPLDTLLHNHLPDRIRSSMGSVISLVLLAGAAISSIGLSLLIEVVGISTVWQYLATFMLFFVVFRLLSVVSNRNKNESTVLKITN